MMQAATSTVPRVRPQQPPAAGAARRAPAPLPRAGARRHAASAAGAAAAEPAAAPPAAELKARAVRLSGSKYGHDLDEQQRRAVQDAVAQLEGLGLPVKVSAEALAGSSWTTVYTTSDGPSSGKVGPFVTEVLQEFPANEPGTYYNISRLGLVSATLCGEFCATRDDRIDLEFRTLKLAIGPVTLATKVFEPGQMRGYWRVTYCDEDFRVFYTNKQNLFVLRRVDA